MPRMNKEQQRLLVAEALRNLNRGIDLLEESELCHILALTPEPSPYWPKGKALATRLREATLSLAEKLELIPRYERHRQILLHVLEGGSVASYGRQIGMSREHLSRKGGVWHQATTLLMEELTALPAVRKAG